MSMLNTQIGDTNLLLESLIAHCGNTAFTLALVDEIMNASYVAGNNTVTNITKPVSFDLCKKATSRDEMNNVINTLDSKAKCELLLYTLYDKSDNKNIIELLAPTITQMEPQSMQTLIAMSQTRQLDKANYDVLSGMSCNVAQIIKMMGI